VGILSPGFPTKIKLLGRHLGCCLISQLLEEVLEGFEQEAEGGSQNVRDTHVTNSVRREKP
jgi:hypothetical protein